MSGQEIDDGEYAVAESPEPKPNMPNMKPTKFEKTPLGHIFSLYPMMKTEKIVSKYMELPPLNLEVSLSDTLKHRKAVKGTDNGIYTGTLNDKNQRHGVGLLAMKDGSIFEGHFENGAIKGFGRLVTIAADVYEGEFEGIYLKNTGIICFAGENKLYKGEVQENVPHGQGEEETATETYKGEFTRGKRNGYGEVICTDGSWFKGHFLMNKLEGKGTYHGVNGNEYSGDWSKSKVHGKGVYTWPDGQQYEGEFKEGFRDGYGIMRYPDGRWYQGYWEKGRQDGVGKEKTESGIIVTGLWRFGQLKKKLGESSSEAGSTDTGMDGVEDVPGNMNDLIKKVEEMRKQKRMNEDYANSDVMTNLADAIVETRNIKYEQIHDKKRKEVKKKKEERKVETRKEKKKKKRMRMENDKELTLSLSAINLPPGSEQLFERAMKAREALPAFNYYEPDFELSEKTVFRNDWAQTGDNQWYRGEVNHKNNSFVRGVLLQTGKIYEGYIFAGKKCGLGRQISSKGDIYEGYWIDNKKHGFGVLHSKTQNLSYAGEWQSNQFHGEGILKTVDAKYTGSWKNNQQHGYGELIYNDGRIFKGNFKKGIIKGYGTILWPDGTGYAGQWENGEIVGIGTKVTKSIKKIKEKHTKKQLEEIDTEPKEESLIPEHDSIPQEVNSLAYEEANSPVPDEENSSALEGSNSSANQEANSPAAEEVDSPAPEEINSLIHSDISA
ncbi:unnamed protein product [Blepharisma stoltei]|uniref:Uncharacterized protein n=1 Tax=Blepharisma stoltei TaxID=1481888 RepID=A0AAU9IT06_9CILI|nr:unnamed protein product [Blepharisma stoltei]